MVRVYSQPGHVGVATLGGAFSSDKSYKTGGGGVDYEEILNQKRRDEARYRHGNDPYNDYRGLNKSTSDGFLNRQPIPSYNNQGINVEMEEMSRALSRLQNSFAPDNPDLPQSLSYPTSAVTGGYDQASRKTWSAPNKDPFTGGGPLDDPFQRRSGYGGQSSNSGGGYQPSFGGDNRHQRVRRGGGNANPPHVDRRNYLHQLSEQVEEQKRRKAREQAEGSTDWWEKKKDPTQLPEYKAPHPSQDHPSYNTNNSNQRKTRNRNNSPSSRDRPDPGEVRRKYELELKEQMEAKKKHDDEIKRKEREEEEKLERRLQEQQDKMKREYEEEQNKKKEKEQAKLKRQEELAKRQAKLQAEMDRQKKEEDMRRHAEKRGVGGRGYAGTSYTSVRADSPPIPTMRGQQREVETRVEDTGSRAASPGVLNQLNNMRQHIDRRRESLQQEDEQLGDTWNGLAEL